MALDGGIFARLHALCYVFFARFVLFSYVCARRTLRFGKYQISQSASGFPGAGARRVFVLVISV